MARIRKKLKLVRYVKRAHVVAARMSLYRGLTNRIPSVYNYKQNVQLPTANINFNGFGAIGTLAGLETSRILPTAAAATLGSSATFALKFLLSDLTQAATFTALYDQYKITKVVIKLYPLFFYGQFGSSAQAVTAVAPTTRVLTLIDYDDAAAPTNLAVMRDYQNCKEWTINGATKPLTIPIVPHIAVAAFGGGVFASYANESKRWLDCGSATIEHYGLKIGIPQVQSAGCITGFDIEAEYYISFKNVR